MNRYDYTQGFYAPPHSPTSPRRTGFYGAVPVDNGSPPSTYAVAGVLNKEPGSVARLVGVTAIRAVCIMPGIWVVTKLVAPEVSTWKTILISLGGSATISIGMLLWYWLRMKGESGAPQEQVPS